MSRVLYICYACPGGPHSLGGVRIAESEVSKYLQDAKKHGYDVIHLKNEIIISVGKSHYAGPSPSKRKSRRK